MTQNTIGGKRLRQKAGMRRASTQDGQQGRHRAGVFAAFGAVAVGALVLAGAVTGSMWSQAGVDRAEARQTEPEASKAVQASAVKKVAAAAEAEVKAPAEAPVEQAQAQPAAEPEVVKVEATRVAGGKADSLSPDERIDRAVDRITAGSTDEDVKKAITVAARERSGETGRSGDTVITAALPESSAYAPAQERAGSSALGAIRDFDRSDEPKTAALDPEPEPQAEAEPKAEKTPARDSRAKTAAAAPTGPLGPATVSTDVHMRAGMDNGSAVVATVPAKAAVQASLSCKSWCEVVYNGHHGYIYKSFVRRGSKPAATASAAPASSKAASGKTAPASANPAAAADQKTAEADTGILAQTGDPAALAEAAERAVRRP